MNKKLFFAIALLALGVTNSAFASLSDAINSLSPGDKYRVLFVTTSLTAATSTSISTYNTFVQTAAAAGSVTSSLGLSWMALASTLTDNAQTNASVLNTDTSPVSFFNTNGDLLAVSGQDLWDGSLLVAVDYTENGSLFGFFVWTGTFSDGLSFDQRELGSLVPGADPNFTVAFGGISNAVNSAWMVYSPGLTIELRSIYGLSSVAVVPSAVPVPAVAWLFATALGGLGFARRRSA